MLIRIHKLSFDLLKATNKHVINKGYYNIIQHILHYINLMI